MSFSSLTARQWPSGQTIASLKYVESPMPSPEKKRDLADFFKPYARAKVVPDKTIPQKRPSPSAEPKSDGISKANTPRRELPSTPTKESFRSHFGSPVRPTQSPISAPRSGTLPFRSPHPRPYATPAYSGKSGKIFETHKSRIPPAAKDAPSFAFADLHTSTQSVVEDGRIIAIRDSDEDDDTDSLESLDDIFGRKREDDATSSSSPPEPDEAKLEAKRVKMLSIFTHGRSEPLVGKDKLRSLYAKERAHKFDISRILGDHLDDEEAEINVRKARADYDVSMKEIEVARRAELDKNILASLIESGGGGDEDFARLMSAVERTEALSSDKTFSFFGPLGVKDWQSERWAEPDFPNSAIPRHLWDSGGFLMRSRAFLSGAVAEAAANGGLSDEAMNWTFQSLVTEQSDALRHAYVECLRQGSKTWTRTNLTTHDIQTCFLTLGAASDSIRDACPIEPRYQPFRQQPRRNPKHLITVLELFLAVCADMDFPAMSKLASVLCRLALDVELMTNRRVSITVENCFERLLGLSDIELRSHVAQRIVSDMGQNLNEPVLQAQLLSHILPISLIACQLRIKLAITFLLGLDFTKNEDWLFGPTTLSDLTDHITNSPTFDTTRHPTAALSIDYADLKARTFLLDTAIGNGHRPPDIASSSATKAFNASVDALADALRARFITIADTGASHMRRTEAKDVMQALYWRLLYSVRTEPRPKKHIFDFTTGKARDGDEVRSEQRGRGFMAQFLAKRIEETRANRAETKAEEDGDGASAGEVGIEGSQPSDSEAVIRR